MYIHVCVYIYKILTYVYTCETITTIKAMDTPLILRFFSFLLVPSSSRSHLLSRSTTDLLSVTV